MRYVAAALLVSMAGNELTRANIQRILESVGVECEDDKLQIVLDQLKGKVTLPHFLNPLRISVADPWHFGVDPDPLIHVS